MSDAYACEIAVPVQGARTPARRGCVAAGCGYVVWVAGLTLILLLVLFARFGPMFAGVSRTLLLPLYMQILDETHTIEQRATFSNAFVNMLTVAESNDWGAMAGDLQPRFTQIMRAARDHVLTTNESLVIRAYSNTLQHDETVTP